MEEQPATPPHTHYWKLQDVPLNPSALDAAADPSSKLARSSSICNTRLLSRATDSTKSTLDSVDRVISPVDKASFRIRPATPKINLTKKKAGALVDIFQNFEAFLRDMIEKGEDVESEADLYLKLLSEYLEEDVEEIKHFKKIEIIADTTNISLQALGDTLKELIELKLNSSIIKSVRDIGTSYKSLKVLWVSRVGLKDLCGLLAFQSLEELYASYNFVSDITDIEYVEKLHTLDLEANSIMDIRQLTYVSSRLKNVVFSGNKVAEHEDYLKTLLSHGTSLETIDDVDVKSLSKDAGLGIAISTPAKVLKSKVLDETDDKLIERLKAFGLSEDLVRESIKLADDFLGNEPSEEEILRQSIKAGNKNGGLKISTVEEPKSGVEQHLRPATASLAGGRYGASKGKKEIEELCEATEVDDQKVFEGYSDLVSNTETVFAGNPLKAAKHKKMIGVNKPKVTDIYELIDQFKDASVSLKKEVNKKMREKFGPEVAHVNVAAAVTVPMQAKPVVATAERVMPDLKGPIKPRGILNVRKIRYIKN